jgi:hypothetical protein
MAQQTSSHILREKIAAAIAGDVIQYPGIRALDNPRGVDTYSDCLVYMMLGAPNTGFSRALFGAPTWVASNPEGDEYHACTMFVDLWRAGGRTPVGLQAADYSRYWWGSATAARIVLGHFGLSIAQYQRVLRDAVIGCSCLFWIVVFARYRSRAVVLLPLAFASVLGFNLLTLGQSVAQAPSVIAAFAVMTLCLAADIWRRGPATRAFACAFAGASLAYFDLMNGSVVLAVMLLAATAIAHAGATQQVGSDTGRDFVCALAFFAAGGVIAMALRIAGAGVVAGTSPAVAAEAWLAAFSVRVSGPIPPELAGWAQALWEFRHVPFHGILGRTGSTAFLCAGAASLLLAIVWLGWTARHQRLRWGIFLPGLVACASVAAWYLLLRQHTVVHPWMTARLWSLLAGMGMTLLILAVHTGRPRPESDNPTA